MKVPTTINKPATERERENGTESGFLHILVIFMVLLYKDTVLMFNFLLKYVKKKILELHLL